MKISRPLFGRLVVIPIFHITKSQLGVYKHQNNLFLRISDSYTCSRQTSTFFNFSLICILKVKVKNHDHHGKFSNLSNWKKEAWKKIRASVCWIRTRDLRDIDHFHLQPKFKYELFHIYCTSICILLCMCGNKKNPRNWAEFGWCAKW